MVRIPVPRLPRPDSGWLYLVPGLTLCIACVVIPARDDVVEQRRQIEELVAAEARLTETLRAYNELVSDIDRAEPSVIRELAATQLNLMPAGEAPVMLVANETVDITDWVDARIEKAQAARTPPVAPRQSRLQHLVSSTNRLWVMAAGAVLAFIGLLLSPGLTRPSVGAEAIARRRSPRPRPASRHRQAPRPPLRLAPPIVGPATIVGRSKQARRGETAACAEAAAGTIPESLFDDLEPASLMVAAAHDLADAMDTLLDEGTPPGGAIDEDTLWHESLDLSLDSDQPASDHPPATTGESVPVSVTDETRSSDDDLDDEVAVMSVATPEQRGSVVTDDVADADIVDLDDQADDDLEIGDAERAELDEGEEADEEEYAEDDDGEEDDDEEYELVDAVDDDDDYEEDDEDEDAEYVDEYEDDDDEEDDAEYVDEYEGEGDVDDEDDDGEYEDEVEYEDEDEPAFVDEDDDLVPEETDDLVTMEDDS